MRIGTSHFVTKLAAYRYYAQQGETRESVDRKLLEGEIHIGRPSTSEPDERLTLNEAEGRYFIEY